MDPFEDCLQENVGFEIYLSSVNKMNFMIYVAHRKYTMSKIAEIKTSLEISKLKGKYGAKSNPILKNISNNISHLTLKKIWLGINRTREIVDNPQNKCGHYLRKLHGLSCTCELAEDIYIFWRKLEIGVDIRNVHERDMDSEMRDLTSMLEEISTGPISKVRECDGNCEFRIVANFLFGDENQWPEIRRRMFYDLHHHMNMHVSLFGSVERVDELIKKTYWEEVPAPYEH
ncbi:hypothetical protein M9H77_11170 [Catharanthus roseus]|uniref:Uncharacterized protein n=1 Tax=Catharanthus roseus TaxID=4058 RepID=A0ACC0BDU9_CATRO|nr:hypothetical protein M9H77_11170 [Catharanthus roseus]